MAERQALDTLDYVILLKDEDTGQELEGREAFYQSGVARNVAFRKRLYTFLEGQGVADQVSFIGDPTVFPVVALRTTPEAAKLIGTLPEVEEVVHDANVIQGLSNAR